MAPYGTDHVADSADAAATKAIVELVELRGQIAAVDIREFETRTGRKAYNKLRPRVLELVEGTTRSLEEIRRAFDDRFELEASISIGLAELKTYRERLEELGPERPGWSVVVESASLLGRAARLVELVVNSVADQITSEVARRSDALETSIAIRMLYGRLMAAVAEGDDPPLSELVVRLRAVGTQMAMMVGRPIFTRLWPRDRLAIQAFQYRIIEWLKNPIPTEGLNLWVDLTGLVTLLRDISRRPELRDHDQALLEEVLASIRDVDNDAVLDLGPQLKRLFGMSAILDRLIWERRTMKRSEWKELLETMQSLMGLGKFA